MLTKKHFIKIAEILNKNKTNTVNKEDFVRYTKYKNSLLKDLCIYFKQENSLFNEEKFKEVVFNEKI